MRPRTNRGGRPGDFMSTHDGDFRWAGEPTRTPAAIDYVSCFHEFDERGGAVLMGTRTIQKGRVGSLVLPGSRNPVMGDDSTVIRDPDVFAAQYAVFEPSGAEPTSLEISLDRPAHDSGDHPDPRRQAAHAGPYEGTGGPLAPMTVTSASNSSHGSRPIRASAADACPARR